jgi:hypothetical protein
MARPWSARCYGVARQREGSRQNSIGTSWVSETGMIPARLTRPLVGRIPTRALAEAGDRIEFTYRCRCPQVPGLRLPRCPFRRSSLRTFVSGHTD